MKNKGNGRRIYDNIYGFISLTPFEDELIKSPYFQRLRHVSQMGTVNYVFPSAEHTRFSHSIGVLWMMQTMLYSINKNVENNINYKRKIRKNLKFSQDEKELLRIAALLHDIGHYPCSHSIEDVYEKHIEMRNNQGKSVIADTNVIVDVTGDKFTGNHEQLGKHIIISIFGDRINEYFGDRLSEYGIINPAIEIGNIITGDSTIEVYNRLMHSDVDADRLDYLARDSQFMGSKYGNFDVDQLVRNIKMIMGNKGKREIVVDKKGLNALENYMLSRYFSRSLLIYNKNIAGFEILLQTAFELLLEKYDKEDANYPYGYQNILKTSTTEDFTTFNDHYILNRIFEEARKSGNTNLKRISKMILYRTPLKGVYKIHNLNKPDTKCVNGLKIEKIKSIHKTSKYSDKFINILWINKKEWAFFKHGEVPMIKNPETAIDIMVDDEEIYKRTLRLHDTSNDEEKFSYLYKDDQSIMAHLCGLKNEVCGIYTTEKHAKSVEREIKKLLSDIS